MEFELEKSKILNTHKDRVWSVDYSCKDLLSSGSGDKSTKIWQKETELDSFTENRTIRRVKFSPDGNQLAACSFNGKIYIYKLEDGRFVGRVTKTQELISIS